MKGPMTRAERLLAGRAAVAADPNDDERMVTVCAKCLMACCWHGKFMCDKSRSADLVDKTVAELKKLGREHSDHWIPGHGIDW